MALEYNTIVEVDVSVMTPNSVPYRFDTGLILGASDVVSAEERMKGYASLLEMEAAGFTAQHPEYVAAALYFAQNPAPRFVYIGRIDKGEAVQETALDALKACREKSAAFYGVYIAAGVSGEIIALQEWLRTEDDMIQFYEEDTAFSVELPPIMEAFYQAREKRAMGIWNTTAAAGAAVMGLAMGLGRAFKDQDFAMAYKELRGLEPSKLSQGEVETLLSICGNVYVKRGSRLMLEKGALASGLRYNEQMQLDRIAGALQEACLAVLADSPTKLPMNDSTSAVFENACSRVLAKAYDRGAISAGQWKGGAFHTLADGDTLPLGYKVMYDSFAQQSPTDRALRHAMPLYAAMIMSGNVEFVAIHVNVQL